VPKARPPEAGPPVVIDWGVEESLERVLDMDLLESAVVGALSGRLGRPLEVGLIVTDDQGSREMNLRYRGVDAPTDVLSFPLLDYERPEKPRTLFPMPPGEPLPLGDIVISYPRAVEQAADFGHPLAREMAFLVVHGAMHLLGYDHEDPASAREMRAQEELVLERLGLGRDP